jgi:glycerol kinase
MMSDAGGKSPCVKVDGGVSKSRFLMQFQADISDVPLKVSADCELTLLGIAGLSGIGSGRWKGAGDIPLREEKCREYIPSMGQDERRRLLEGWGNAVIKCKNIEKQQ